jgi:beta-galactosidase
MRKSTVPRSNVMMFIVCLLSAAFFSLSAATYSPPHNGRAKTVFNAGWKYISGTPTGTPEAVSFDDSQWQQVGLPHCFNIPWWVNQHINFGGTGWYRKHFTLDASYSGKRISLEFEGVFLHCWIYVNGVLAGEHKGGFTSFTYDITDKVTVGGADNVVAVKVSSDLDMTIAPLAGDYVFIGGIYRDVYLLATDPLHVAWYGTYVTTPFGGSLTSSGNYTLPSSYSQAPVRVRTEVQNQNTSSATCALKTYIVDSNNVLIDSMASSATIGAGIIDTITQACTLATPHFWSPADPYLYKVYTEIVVNGTTVDLFQSPLGVRWLQFTGQQGCWINGKQTYLHGLDVHQDHAGWATAATNAGQYRDVKLCKDAGAVFIRGSHYPKDPAFVKACDQLGVCLMLEMCYWGKGGGSGSSASPAAGTADFTNFVINCKAQMREMIRTFRNDPSVIIWSLANEPTGGVLNCDTLNAVAKAEDPSRPTCRVSNFSTGSAEDIAGHNGNADPCGAKPTLFTELWENAEVLRPGTYAGQTDAENQCRIGTARWAAFDYGTHENWTLNLVGMCDNNRLPKHRFYWYRNMWLKIPPPAWPVAGTPAKLSITTDKTTILNDGTDDCQLIISVLDASNTQINNSVSGTLTVSSGSGLLPTGTTWNFTTPDGKQAIEMRSYGTGTITVTATSGSLTAGTIQISAKAPEVGVIKKQPVVAGTATAGQFKITASATGTVRMAYDLSSDSDVRLSICTLNGRVAKMLENGHMDHGRHVTVWDGNDDRGRPVALGCYIAVMKINGTNNNFMIRIIR